MANFLRDWFIVNVSVNEQILRQLNELFIKRCHSLNTTLSDRDTTQNAYINYIIRFDGKGYRIFNFDDMLRYFFQAKEIERITFTLETTESLRSNRQTGTYIELRLDQWNPNNCCLWVASDDEDWVEVSFSATQAILVNCKNKNGLARTAWTPLAVQIMGIAVGFFISLWAAVKLSPKLSIQNSFVICFFFVLLIFSNTWDYINQKIILLINKIFPNLKFYRHDKDQSNWLMQAIAGGLIVAITLWIINLALSYIINVLKGFMT